MFDCDIDHFVGGACGLKKCYQNTDGLCFDLCMFSYRSGVPY